jgi:hypothetical protein
MDQSRFQANFIALVATGLIIGAMLRLPPVYCVNDASRWDSVWALLNGRGYVLDYNWSDGKFEAPYDLANCDQVKIGNKFYSSKPPLLPTVLAGIAWVVRAVTGMQIPEHDDFVVRFILLLVNVLPFAIMLILYAGLLERLGYSQATRLFCLCAAGFGTYLTAYSVTLNNHTIAAWSTFFAIYCLIRIKYEQQTQWQYFVLCGTFTGWTVANEMVAAPFALMIYGWLMYGHSKQTLKYAVAPSIVLAAAYLFTTYLATDGSLVPNYLVFKSSRYFYPGSHWLNPPGIDGANDPKWFYLFNLTLGHHGILGLTPVMLIAFYGMVRRTKKSLGAMNLMALINTVGLLLFYTIRTNNYGGGAQGPRWFFWLIPMWLIAMAPVVEEHIGSTAFRRLAMLALLISVVTVGHALSGPTGPWSDSWLMTIMRGRGWITY